MSEPVVSWCVQPNLSPLAREPDQTELRLLVSPDTMKLQIVLVIASVFTAAYAAVGQVCMTEAECDPGECCQILSEFMVVSKRDLLPLQTLPPLRKTGTCHKYQNEGDHCNTFDKINGYCSCAPGLKCNTYQVALPTLKPVMTMAPTVVTHMMSAARRAFLPPKDGYEWVSKCEKINP
ncbi:U3-aranetoxin-ce1a-like isoform x1 [Plakobranchus ocellatus]|uniref:U3-aranetoxin-ce1a-like isoform x1 n=1 Tax=Plakobranchus ocellatus TaxID=259542 RepID=A0AAV4BYL5_9GAST|nr:U3-aranetoxin-ce1a-like isoform x1 [Plakobranchus ocellatus]